MGRGVWWGSAPRTAEGAKRRRSQGGYVGVAPPRRKGGSERYRHWLLPSLGDGEGASYSGVARNLLRGQELGCKRSAAQQPPDVRWRKAP